MQIDWTRYPEREEEDDPIELDEEDEEERLLIQKRQEKRKGSIFIHFKLFLTIFKRRRDFEKDREADRD